MTGIRDARSLLFVPGTRADRFDRALASGAEAVILDLEDSVAPADKASARAAAHRWLAAGQRAVVRVNAVGTPWHADDLRMAAAVGCPVLLPKADTVEAIADVRASLPEQCALLALVETARGVRDVAALCDSRSIDRVAFGSVDFAVELGLDPVTASATLGYARSALVVASAAAGLPPPLDGVTTAVDAPAQLAADVRNAVSIGFGGKLAIHPRQVAVINHAWTPAPALVSWAERVIAAVTSPTDALRDYQSGEPTEVTLGVTTVDGQMVDLPLITRARRILSRATLTATPTTANGMT
jgi:citrate lyase subunit beta / citryl-CoA lyase